MKPSKDPENGKAIPVKLYDFQVDFKLGEDEVVKAFLDPKSNKHISIMKRPQTSRVGTFGTSSRNPEKKSVTIHKNGQETKLALIGSTGNIPKSQEHSPDPPAEIQDNGSTISPDEKPKSTFKHHAEGLSANLFRFTSSLPAKKLADNPNIAMSIMKKKTLGNKSQGVIRGPNPDTTEISMTYPDPVQQFNLIGKSTIDRPQSASFVKGLPPGKKITKQSLVFLQKKKEETAGISSGQSVTFDKKKKAPKFGDGKTKRPNSASAHVSAALDFMKKLTGKDGRKKPNVGGDDFGDDGFAEVDSQQEDEQEPPKPKARPQSAVQPAQMKMKEFIKKPVFEPVVEIPHNNHDQGHDIPELDRDDVDVVDGDDGDAEGPENALHHDGDDEAGDEGKPEDEGKVEAEGNGGEDGGDHADGDHGDDDFERAENQDIVEGDEEHQDGVDNEEDMNDRDAPDLTLTGTKVNAKAKDENKNPNVVNNEKEKPKPKPKPKEEENDLFKKEDQASGDQAAPPPVNKFYSNTAKALAGLNPSLLYGSQEDTRLSESRELASKKVIENKDKATRAVPSLTSAAGKPRRKGANAEPVVSKLTTDFDKIGKSIDPNIAEEHKQKVTEQVKAYLTQADERRKKKFGVMFGDREDANHDDEEPEEQDDGKNYYTSKITKVNKVMDNSIQKMKSIIDVSKSIDRKKTQKKWTQKKTQVINTPEEFFELAENKRKELETQPEDISPIKREFHFDQMEQVREWDHGSVGSMDEDHAH